MEQSITLSPEIEEGIPLTINGDPPDGETCMFAKGMYLYVFYCCLYYDTDISTDMSEEQVVEERDPELQRRSSDLILSPCKPTRAEN